MICGSGNLKPTTPQEKSKKKKKNKKEHREAVKPKELISFLELIAQLP